MKVACFIPIKKNSERVSGKNFRLLNGKKLYEYILLHVQQAEVFDDIYVDTNSEEIADYAKKQKLKVIPRKENLASNSANGNDLLLYHAERHPEYDYYFQLFATAPFLQSNTIQSCVNTLVGSTKYDSCFTATRNNGFFWLNNLPVNYQPNVLPRSQDLTPVLEETTGLYGISKASLLRFRCRIGAMPYIHIVNKFEAVDINSEEDLQLASLVGEVIWNYGLR